MVRITYIFIIIMFSHTIYGNDKESTFPHFSFQTLTADFIQQKYLSILQDKIIIKGSLKIKKPNILRFETLTPVKQVILINDNIIQIKEENSEIKTIKLSELPMMADNIFIFLEVFRGSNVSNFFNINSSITNPSIFECVPKIKKNSLLIKKITFEIDDKHKYLSWIKIEEPEGDYMYFQFLNIKIDIDLSDDEIFIST